MKTKIITIVMFCMCLIGLCSCAGTATDGKRENRSLDVKMEAEKENSSIDSNRKDTKDDDQDEGNMQEDLSLEEELNRYRQERENNIEESSGATFMGSPEGEYDFTADLDRIVAGMPQFDIKEMGEAYAVAQDYVKDVLAIQPPTKNTVYTCVDPRIAAIYEDEDKGVAAGYGNDQIFVCEYCDEDRVWQYLILVRDDKEAQWKVIHSGRNYKE